MLSENAVSQFQEAVRTCNGARSELEQALDSIPEKNPDDELYLRSVAETLESWRDGQRHFMEILEEASAPDLSTAAMLLKMNHGIDATNARCGIPGVPVEGADQPFPLDLMGRQGTVLTEAAMEYVTSGGHD